jgi:hypothetical protein
MRRSEQAFFRILALQRVFNIVGTDLLTASRVVLSKLSPQEKQTRPDLTGSHQHVFVIRLGDLFLVADGKHMASKLRLRLVPRESATPFVVANRVFLQGNVVRLLLFFPRGTTYGDRYLGVGKMGQLKLTKQTKARWVEFVRQ